MTEEWKDFESYPDADLAQELAEFIARLFLQQGRKTGKDSFFWDNAKKFWEDKHIIPFSAPDSVWLMIRNVEYEAMEIFFALTTPKDLADISPQELARQIRDYWHQRGFNDVLAVPYRYFVFKGWNVIENPAPVDKKYHQAQLLFWALIIDELFEMFDYGKKFGPLVDEVVA